MPRVLLERPGGAMLSLDLADLTGLLALARAAGWHDAGAEDVLGVADESGAWVETVPALRLAVALTDALPDVPRHAARPGGRPPNVLERHSGRAGRESVEEFVGYCRGGGFVVTCPAGPV